MLLHTRYGNPFRFRLLAPDNGPSGGGAPGPKPTIEDRLATAEQARDQHAKDLTEARSQLGLMTTARDEAKTESTLLAGLFESATKAASDAQAALKTAQDAVTSLTTERDALSGKLKTSDENVARLESLCGVKGVDPKGAVPSIAAKSAGGNDLFKQWQELKKTDPVKATAFFRKHQSDMRSAQADA